MSSNTIGAAVSTLVPVVLAGVGAALHGSRRRAQGRDALEVWILWWLIAGLMLASAAVVVTFWAIPQTMADQIGYQATPFQYEISGANLASVVGGYIAIRRPEWRLPVTTFALVFLWNAAFGHMYQAFVNGNWNAGNGVAVWIADLAIPGVLLGLLLAQRRRETGS